ncbi:MAG: insulinase family protein [Oscillospiraceae bacterium]
MPVTRNRIELSDGIYLTTIKDPKFKTNSVTVRFITKLAPATNTAYALACSTAVTANRHFPTRTALTKELTKLYGAALGVSTFKLGDTQINTISAKCICDEYALDGEAVTAQTVALLLDCLFEPVLEDGGFAQNYFLLRRQELIDNIAGEINDKRGYALMRAGERIFEGEAAALTSYGTIAAAQTLTAQETYRAYCEMLRTAAIEITIAGGGDFSEACDTIAAMFSQLDRACAFDGNYGAASPLKSKVVRVTETLDVNQCKTVHAFKSDCVNLYAMKVFCAMLGGTPFSKLFTNVREKLSLCYYCAARSVDNKGVLLIDSGVEKKNISLAETEILKQLEALTQSDFTDAELDDTKLFITDGYRSNNDDLSSLSAWYFLQTTRGTDYTPEDAIGFVNAVTRADIIAAAQSCQLDTVYVMENA